MGDKTGIEWTDATWNPLRGCSRVSEGCRHCYAETFAARFSDQGAPYHGIAERGRPGSKWTGKISLVEHILDQPLKWKKPRRIFVNSMSDLFHESVPDEWIDRIFAVMALAPQHTFQVLTKRSARMLKYCSNIQKHGNWLNMEQIALDLGFEPRGADNDAFDWLAHKQFLPNVWLGVSVENQTAADERIPLLLDTPAAKRFLSCEPLLGPINLDQIQAPRYVPEDHEIDWKFSCLHTGDYYEFQKDEYSVSGDGPYRENRIDWVIVGGESGDGARPMHPQWARDIRDQCAVADVPFFFKQWGEWTPGENCDHAQTRSETAGWFDEHWRFEEISPRVSQEMHRDDEPDVWRVGKKAAGALLDGIEHKTFPS